MKNSQRVTIITNIIITALYLRDDRETNYVKEKKEEEDSPALKIVSMHRYNDE